MKYDFLVLGADGTQGRIVLRDLLKRGYSVYASDLYNTRISKLIKSNPRAKFTAVDLRDIDTTINIIEKSRAEVVINCAEGDWNMNVYNACLQTQTHCVDLGSRIDMTKAQLAMDRVFRRAGLTAITGCGSVPGIGNVMLRYAARKFDALDTVHIGFSWDSNIKKFVVPFSMESIFEEFTIPAPYVANGSWRKKQPMDTRQNRYFRAIGYQEVFLSDHSETLTFHHYFRRQGLKNIKFFAGFPEHSVRTIRTLIDLGFNDDRPLRINNADVRPSDFVVQLLKRQKTPRGYREWENLWVEVSGRKGRKRKTILMECIVPTLPDWEDAGCNIDTAFPAVIMAVMIRDGVIGKRGSFAPEAVVPVKDFFKALKKRKMQVYENGALIN